MSRQEQKFFFLPTRARFGSIATGKEAILHKKEKWKISRDVEGQKRKDDVGDRYRIR